ncbi:response regulator transcription factor [Robertmurraya yapensis]|uniref:Response regulator transcription factor n=1 Tax=Bacillus yapensis TaxID=2492960 RepID=A0A3S0KKQ8_9BACI|nr:response regulator transcription factor [Bacillus yapensis]RTR33118.1 response regulator transcription factor [Bacillus yapensis]TKS96941.1 response regulator [Bacillus yapensis]
MVEQIKILVVEDDNDINQLLCNIIRNSGYVPQAAFSGTEAMLYLEKEEWDLVLLDLMLPGMSGEEVLATIAATNSTPVIIISAKLDQQTKVGMIRTGADDYITKPFDIEEVSARIDSHLRRYQRINKLPSMKKLTFKDIEIDLEAKTVSAQGKELSFTAREYEILVLLLSSPKKVFTKKNLFESVWEEPFYGDDNTMNVHISNIRSKLALVNPNEKYIETIWGMGYRLKS